MTESAGSSSGDGKARRKPNLLINEKSPYLLLHAYNPVEWHPWGEEAFEKAKKENKPVFLSIGYSSCHWCHVMEKESFDDPEVAKLMNRIFVNIKVDREERPDIDMYYMKAAQLMTGGGGWPLNVIITPGKRPFFAATYIPKESMYNKIGMLHLIPQIRQIWRENKKNVLLTANEISLILEGQNMHGPDLDRNIHDRAYMELSEGYDKLNGGFGYAPKFLNPSNLFFLLRYWKRTGAEDSLKMVEKTLTQMRLGGVFDQIGLGFHRYSADSRWSVPHFEKMLYDQALMAIAYSEAYQATKNEFYARVAQELFEFVFSELLSKEGGFFSSIDADSQGQEGKYYLWEDSEIKGIFSEEEYQLFNEFFITRELSQDDDEPINNSVVKLRKNQHAFPDGSIQGIAGQAQLLCGKLHAVRSMRQHPVRDEKILADWNGLMIAALSIGARVLRNEDYSRQAKKSISFLLDNLFKDGKLYHGYKEGLMDAEGFSSDYAYLVWALLETYETTFDAFYLEKAKELNKQMLDLFWDKKGGGLYYDKRGLDSAAGNTKDLFDGALPSVNSVALLNILKLSKMTGDLSLRDKAQEIVHSFSNLVINNPSSYPMFLSSHYFMEGPTHELVISGDRESEATKKMIDAIRNEFVPNKIVMLNPESGIFPEQVRSKNISIGTPIVYVCSDYACKEPATDIDIILRQLNVARNQ